MGYFPPSCSACSVTQITPSWLLLIGGQGPSMQPQRCIQRLHLSTLSWRPPIDVAGGSSTASNIPSSIPSRTPSTSAACPQGVCGAPVGCEAVGCATEACVLVGGLEDGAYGRNIVPRLQVLLPGPVIPAAAAGQDSRGVGDSPTAGSAHAALTALSGHLVHTQLPYDHHHLQQQREPLQQQQQQQQSGAQGQQQATTSCRCGSCCTCLTAAAAAASAAASGVPPSRLQGSCSSAGAYQQQQQQQRRPDGPNSAPAPGMPSLSGPGGPGQYTNAGPQHMPGAKSRPGAIKCLPACLQDPSLTLNGLQGPTGWSGEFQIEPAPALPQAFSKAAGGMGQGQQQGLGQLQGCGPLGGESNAGCSVGGGGGGNAGSERVWQMCGGSSSRSSEGWGLQMVLALVVVLVGLILMAPSVLLHRTA
jgi:hypothetical protein